MKLRAILRRMLSMCPEAWYIFKRCLQLSAFLMLCAFALLVEWGGSIMERYELYKTAVSLMETTGFSKVAPALFSASRII